MGIELRYQGLPPGCGLIDLIIGLAAIDPEAAARAQFIPFWFQQPPGRLDDQDPIWAWCRHARIKYPDIGSRSLDLDRAFDKLFYLLSAWRRSRKNWHRADKALFEEFDVLIGKAFWHGDVVAPNVRATQGDLIRMISQQDTSTIATCVACLEFKDIVVHYDPDRMYHCAVYKSHPGPGIDEHELRQLEELFDQFKAFFAQAAGRQETIIFWID